jgi:hypothetical protein
MEKRYEGFLAPHGCIRDNEVARLKVDIIKINIS